MTEMQILRVAVPAELAAAMRSAIAAGDYGSDGEVIRDALLDWTQRRMVYEQSVAGLRQRWNEALQDSRPGMSADAVLDRLERKYQALGEGASTDGR